MTTTITPAPIPETVKVLLYSGGFDSTAATHLWEPDRRLFVDMGTAENRMERSNLPPDVEVVDLPLAQFELPNKIIPMRNMFLVTVASIYGTDIALAATAGDRVLDKSDGFALIATGLLTYLWQPQHWTPGKLPTVHLPLKHLTKRQIVDALVARGVDIEVFARSFRSCYEPGPASSPCGLCKPCVRNWIALACHGVNIHPETRGYVAANVDSIVDGRGAQETTDLHDALEATS